MSNTLGLVSDGGAVISREDRAAARRMRKGTRSCTECRRRKIRCLFLPGNSHVCSRCSSRGLQCIDQRHAGAGQADDEKKTLRERVARLEALLEKTHGNNSKDEPMIWGENRESDHRSEISMGSNGDYLAVGGDIQAPLMSLFDENTVGTLQAFFLRFCGLWFGQSC
ncbi:hypothetical protein K469DRAFT_605751 [Zopfia rhizophila CBS 207.26]|uniref:Zn(2)-C6 fungal-type domain-containing protein n=1 Tax=Zopfia rhizophila CBS 207.26 TaxID=1314779 RepID=A0A6A6DEF0_9PEZI|nr:hypothetical protein K469DRAFT_605751 [Zopfia rhizophila CBS 207.26]